MPLVRKTSSKIYQKLFFQILEHCNKGAITVQEPNGQSFTFTGSEPGKGVLLEIRDTSCYRSIIKEPDAGFGETYMQGLWDTPHLPDLLTFFAQNLNRLQHIFVFSALKKFSNFFSNIMTRNTRRGSKRNIINHYDLSNEFYELWLDESMTYSSALYEMNSQSLAAAQKAKLNRVLSKMPSNASHLLEIGCGWGSFLELAGRHQLQIDGITLSPSQAKYAQARMADNNLSSLAKIELRDYRDVQKQYDGIVSIEMFEAVGHQYWHQYFSVLKSALKKGGQALIQVITIPESVFEEYIAGTDFIRKHIFPGGVLPSKTKINEILRAVGLEIKDQYQFADSYAMTLLQWLENFDRVQEKVKGLGFNDEFIRKWRFYLAYCAAGFAAKHTDVVQYTLAHDLSR